MPWALGPPDGRYLLRAPGHTPGAPPTHVLVIATLGAPERRRLAAGRKKQREAQPEPEPSPVTTGRATVIDVGAPFDDVVQARAWLANAGTEYLADGLEVLNRALHAFRLVTADPYLNTVSAGQALVARIGFGAGEQVADGLWTDAQELLDRQPRLRRLKVLQPQARLAAVLERTRAAPRLRGARAAGPPRPRRPGAIARRALQLLVALDAALAELPSDPTAAALADRLRSCAASASLSARRLRPRSRARWRRAARSGRVRARANRGGVPRAGGR